MNTLIFRTVAPLLVSIMLVMSLFVLLRGHNEPGGGFIGGLIAAAGFALLGMAFGPKSARAMVRVPPIGIAATGLLVSALAGVAALPFGLPFLTGLWPKGLPISSPMVFDIGVYLVVVGSISAIAFALEEGANF
jgi:multicomponent Na+:H+ antiporter subunit B